MKFPFRKVLHFENISYVDIHKSHGEVIQVLADPYYSVDQQYFSEIGLFVQKGAGIKDAYNRAVEEYYRSKIEDVDFGASGSGEVVSAVNRLVE